MGVSPRILAVCAAAPILAGTLAGVSVAVSADGSPPPGTPDRVYVAMAFSRLHELPTPFSPLTGLASFGADLQVRDAQYGWYQVQLMPDEPDSLAWIHIDSVLDAERMEFLLGENPDDFARRMAQESGSDMATGRISEGGGTEFGARGFSERSGVSFSARGFSERNATSFGARGFSERAAVSFGARGFSERSATDFAARAFSERSASSFGARGFSERSGTDFASRGFSERSASSFGARGFDDDQGGRSADPPDEPRYDLVDLIDDSDQLTVDNPTEQLRRFRLEGGLGEYKWND